LPDQPEPPDEANQPNAANRLVALDVDGTLVDFDDRMSETVRSEVRRLAQTRGTHVVIATGRSLIGLLPILDRLQLSDGFAICSNGAVTVRLSPDGGSGGGPGIPSYDVVEQVTFDAGPAVRLLAEHLPDARFAVEVLGVGYRVHGSFPEGELTGAIENVSFEELTRDPVGRVVVRSPEHTPEHFLELVSRIGLHGVSYAVGWTAWLDLAPEGVSKASGLEAVRRVLGVQPTETYAVGDGRNDMEMIRWAAHGAVMASAPPEVLALADEVLPDVSQDGLLQLLGRL
jgi:hydroxymethylpyrimidine pyrophosphatase-like HAD family hydrolase